MDSTDQVTQFLRFLLDSFISPDDYQLEVNQTDQVINYSLNVNQDKTGLVIGRQGRTINAIRRLLQVKAAQNHQKVFLQVNTAQENPTSTDNKIANPSDPTESRMAQLSQIIEEDN